MSPEPDAGEYDAVADFRSALRSFLRTSENVTRAYGLTPGHYDLLVMIKAAGGEGATMSWLADRLAVEANSATELVDRAQAAQLVHRGPDSQDRRVVRVSLTAKGDHSIADAVAALRPQRLQLLELLADAGERLRASASPR